MPRGTSSPYIWCILIAPHRVAIQPEDEVYCLTKVWLMSCPFWSSYQAGLSVRVDQGKPSAPVWFWDSVAWPVHVSPLMLVSQALYCLGNKWPLLRLETQSMLKCPSPHCFFYIGARMDAWARWNSQDCPWINGGSRFTFQSNTHHMDFVGRAYYTASQRSALKIWFGGDGWDSVASVGDTILLKL